MRSWFNGRTGPCQGSDSGPIPGGRTNLVSFIFILIYKDFIQKCG